MFGENLKKRIKRSAIKGLEFLLLGSMLIGQGYSADTNQVPSRSAPSYLESISKDDSNSIRNFSLKSFDAQDTHLAQYVAPFQSVTLVWDANTEPDLAGYISHWGPGTGVYTNACDVGNVTTTVISNLVENCTYYFVVTAYNTSGLESEPSNEVVYRPPTWVDNINIYYVEKTGTNYYIFECDTTLSGSPRLKQTDDPALTNFTYCANVTLESSVTIDVGKKHETYKIPVTGSAPSTRFFTYSGTTNYITATPPGAIDFTARPK